MYCKQNDCPSCCGGMGPELVAGLDNTPRCRVLEELSLLFDISYSMESSLELREVIHPVLEKMAQIMGLHCGTIMIRSRHHGEWAISETVDLKINGQKRDTHLAFCRSVIDEVVRTGQPMLTPVPEDLGCILDTETMDGHKTPVMMICVPIKFGEDIVGSLSAERHQTKATDLNADTRLLSLIATIIAQSVHFHRLTEDKLDELRRENERLQEQIKVDFRPKNMLGNSNAMRSVYHHIEQVASSSTTVLIRGESGTGKELIAHALHAQSLRSKRSFVKFNCAALPDSIIESELFGHEKGAFTGAIAMRKGRFELADGGTIFLDEIGDISATVQVKLLRVIQEKTFERVGGNVPIKVDVRIITATSRNLEQMIEENTFRQDLYYRLNVFPIYLPALKDRKADLLLMADSFVERYAKASGKKINRITTAAIDLLMRYHWPGNVRELENCIERAVICCMGEAIEAHHLPPTLQMAVEEQRKPSGNLDAALSSVEYELIVAELKESKGNMARAAKNLGLTERMMSLRVHKYNIDYKRFRK